MRDVETELAGREVVIVDDILDSGRTLAFAKALLERRGALSVKTCILLDKHVPRAAPIVADFARLSLPARLRGGLRHGSRPPLSRASLHRRMVSKAAAPRYRSSTSLISTRFERTRSDVEAERREMRRHQPAGLRAVGDDERLDVERCAQLILQLRPKLSEPALGDHLLEVGARRREDAVIAVELPIGEPEAVVGARVEPAEIVLLRAVAQDRRSGADIVGDAVDELEQIVGPGIEHRFAFFQPLVERP